MKIQNIFKLLVAAILMTLPISDISRAQSAGSATLTLSPSSKSVEVGKNLTVTINENSGTEPVNAVQADLTYDESELEFVSINSAGNAFAFEAEETGGGGRVEIAVGHTSGLTGSRLVSSVTFKALKGSGSTSIRFASSSAIVTSNGNQDIWDGSTTGGTYSFTSPDDDNVGGGGGGSDNDNDSNDNDSDNNDSDSGDDKKPADDKPRPDNEPVPVAPQNGVKSYLVAIKVIDRNNAIKADVEVKLDETVVKTDDKGIASFGGISAGEHTVEVLGVKETIKVADTGKTTEVQQFEINLSKSSLPFLDQFKKALPYVGGTVLLVLLGLGVMKVLRGSRFSNYKNFPSNYQADPSKIVTSSVETPKNTPPPTQQAPMNSPQPGATFKPTDLSGPK